MEYFSFFIYGGFEVVYRTLGVRVRVGVGLLLRFLGGCFFYGGVVIVV